MKLPERLNKALIKLYTAFNDNQLHPEDACKCAVGNLLNQKDYWKNLSDEHGSLQLNYVGKVQQAFGKKFEGYTPLELLQIEQAFLLGCGYSVPLHYKGKKPINPQNTSVLFSGLESAIKKLCDIEGLPNLMETVLVPFETLEQQKNIEKNSVLAI